MSKDDIVTQVLSVFHGCQVQCRAIAFGVKPELKERVAS